MATAFPGQVSAIQVGSFFVGQYYHILQQQPNLVYQFYNDASTVMRVDDGDLELEETNVCLFLLSTAEQIHSLIMSLKFTGIEIKTAHSLNSWNGGVLLMVCGFVQTGAYNARRNFVQTFFLAPQEKGYFVLNDIFHFLDEEHLHQHTPAILAPNNYEKNSNMSSSVPEAGLLINCFEPKNLQVPKTLKVSDYMLGGEIQSKEYVAPVQAGEADIIDNYSIIDSQHQVGEPEDRVDDTPAEDPVLSFPNAMNVVQDPSPASAAEHLRISKHQPGNSALQRASLSKPTVVASEWHHTPQATPQQAHPSLSTGPEKSSPEIVDEAITPEGEEKSVYVGNLPSSVSAFDLENEFKNFGRLKPDGVAVRSRKDSGGHYAFVEFEDAAAVQNALKASPIQLNGWQIYVEERRPNSGISRGRRGRGRGGYQSGAPRGRFGARSLARKSGADNSDRDYIGRPRGNGFHQRGPRQERGILGSQDMRNGQQQSSVAAA
ncbi:ras GTPase-activating protein-binding protein 1 [Cocos nucifera]|uniref:Ras GTPase-activating protein-binding protein 1 n=1 Tax=Cocos nucifera TaxID=13894 RepID=A0A8K0N751_COCNU|nr:ras GTPase-activating protein-binding protein 1 [Cocos nucifera]